MRRYLLVALWPAGIAAIAAATVIAARRAPVSPALATADDLADQETGPAPPGRPPPPPVSLKPSAGFPTGQRHSLTGCQASSG